VADIQALLPCVHSTGISCTYAGAAIFLVSTGPAMCVLLGCKRSGLWACEDDEPGAVSADGGKSASSGVALGMVYA